MASLWLKTSIVALPLTLVSSLSLAQQKRTVESPLLTYISAGEKDVPRLALAKAMGNDSMAYDSANELVRSAKAAVFHDNEDWVGVTGLNEEILFPRVTQSRDTIVSNRGSIANGPLFYLSNAQRDWYSNLSSRQVAVPDFTIENMATFWTGACTDYGKQLVPIETAVKFAKPKEVFRFFNEVVYASFGLGSSLDFGGGPLVPKREGMILGGTWAERMLFPNTVKELSLFDISKLNSVGGNPYALLSPKHRSEVRLSDLNNLASDIYFFGRIRGVAPLNVNSVVAYGGTNYGKAVNAPIALFPNGTFIAFLPCVTMRQAIERPVVLRFRADSGENYLVPLRLTDEEHMPSNMASMLNQHPLSVRTGLRPSTWGQQRLIHKFDSQTLASLLSDTSASMLLASETSGLSASRNVMSSTTDDKDTIFFRMNHIGYDELMPELK